MNKGFRILNFKICGVNKSEKFENIDLQFSSQSINKSANPFITLVIGANATGKSRLLRVLVDVFIDLLNLKNERRANFSFREDYLLKYYFNSSLFIVENKNNELFFSRNGLESSIEHLELPSKLIGASYSITDRFPQKTNNFSNLRVEPYKSQRKGRYENDFYEYIGVRTFNNMASATGHITRTLDLLVDSYINGRFNNSIINVFQTLNLMPVLSIEYRLKRYSSLLENKSLTHESLLHFIKNLEEKKTGFSYKYFIELQNSETLRQDFIDYVNILGERKTSNDKLKNGVQIFDLNFEDTNSFSRFISEYKMLDLLRKLNMVGYGSVNVYRKNGEVFDINRGSSGEISLFTSLISLACVVERNSLIMIDEPEISLHPNWQMEYLKLVNLIFQYQFSNCHFIICTHSHFLVSDLPSKSSYILSLKYDKDENIKAIPVPSSTFGWSAEQILLEVFNVPTTRNYYVAEKLGEIFELISKPKEERKDDLIEEKVRNLIEYNIDKLSVEDPLSDVISKLIQKYGVN